MSEMGPARRRGIQAMYGGQPDRVPCVPLIDNSYSARVLGVPVSKCFVSPMAHAESLAACFQRHRGIDGLSINLCLADEVVLNRQALSDGYLIETTGGITWKVPNDDIGTVLAHDITSFDDPRLGYEDPLKPGILQTLQALPPEIRRQYLINVGVTGPFSQLVFLMGLERVLLATIEEPHALHRAIEKRLPLALQWVQEIGDLDPGCIWIGEGVASSSLISRAAYREFVLPYESALADQIRRLGVPSVLHICGKIDPILGDVPETGVDCLEADWPVDMAEAKARIGAKVALKGNLNTTTLVQAAPEEIYHLSRDLIWYVARGGGFVLSSGCALGRDTPPGNVDAMSQAAQDEGWYTS